jgi:C1A family cysteine protease
MHLSCKNRFLLASSLCLLFITAWLWFEVPHVVAQVSIAPEDPHFLEYQQNLQKSNTQDAVGFIPSPLNLSHLNGEDPFLFSKPVDFPSSYDLRNLQKLPPIKDQGPCNSDWAFATFGSLETSLFPPETWDFSENNLKNTHGFDPGHCEGGNAIMSAAYLARWSGPMSEIQDPYNPFFNASPSELKVKKHVQEVLIIPGRAKSLDNENIKQAIMAYGPVHTSMYFKYHYYDIMHKTYYYYGTSFPNRSVAIVGWDDNFDRARFSINAPGDGAFIVRNSLGTNWGEEGYFYVSYYDSRIGKENYVFSNAESTTNYYHIYQYDPLGWVNSLGYEKSSAWFANIFTATEDELLKAVSFYVASPNSSYEIYVYLDADSGPTSGSLFRTQTGTIAFPGYHTVHLDNPTVITLKQKFSILVKLTTPGYDYPIPVEYPVAGYSSQASANPGESYISGDGITWEDLTSSIANANVCLKAFTLYINSSPDFDGDGKTDIGLYRANIGAWFVIPSTTNIPYGEGFGGDPSDIPVSGDYDGDRKTDYGIYRLSTGAWFIFPSKTGVAYGVGFGGDASDKPVPGDYDGDGTTDLAIYRSATGAWFIYPSSTGSSGIYGVGFGGDPSDIPVPADYDADGKTDIAIYRSATGAWYIYPSSTGAPGIYGVGFGGDSSDKPVPADYDRDGKADIAIYRSSTGAWFIYPSLAGAPGIYGVGFGGDASDKPVPGDYDGDRMADLAIYRSSIGAWFIYPSSTGPSGIYAVGFGGDASDLPIVNNPAAYM